MSSGALGAAELDRLGDRLGHRFNRPELLAQAMAHRSWVAEHPGTHSNERLEFLGDAVLGWVVAHMVFHRFDDLPEGALTDLRKQVVNAGALAEMARSIDLGEFLLLGRGEDAGGGRDKVSILSDAMEAVIGAVYVDAGAGAAQQLVEQLIGDRLDSLDAAAVLDVKSLLQETAARLGFEPPRYTVRAEGPDHKKEFQAVVHIGDRRLGTGTGSSKKLAERDAARRALGEIDPYA